MFCYLTFMLKGGPILCKHWQEFRNDEWTSTTTVGRVWTLKGTYTINFGSGENSPTKYKDRVWGWAHPPIFIKFQMIRYSVQRLYFGGIYHRTSTWGVVRTVYCPPRPYTIISKGVFSINEVWMGVTFIFGRGPKCRFDPNLLKNDIYLDQDVRNVRDTSDVIHIV